MSATLLGAIAAPLLFIAFLFQLLTLKHSGLDARPIAKHGKRLMAAGFLLASLRFWFLPYFPIPLGIFSYILIGLGSLVMNFDRIIDTCEFLRQEEQETIQLGNDQNHQ